MQPPKQKPAKRKAPKRKPGARPPGTRTVEVEVSPVKTGRPAAWDDTVVRRQEAAYRLSLLGKTRKEIAEVLGVALRTAYDYVEKGRERQTDQLRKLEGRAGVMKQFGVLDHILDEMLDRWERSTRIRRTKIAGVETKEFTVGKGADGVAATETKKKSSQKEEDELGDVAYIDRALRASKEIRELLGLDAPEVKRLLMADDPVIKDLNHEDLRTLPTEELLRRYRAAAGLSSELG